MKRHRGYLLTLLLCVLVGCDGGGDRVLVAKFLYDSDLLPPERYDVVVFKYPSAPVDKGVAKNYIKRLLGLPGELLAIFFGRVYRYNAEKHGPVNYDDHLDPLELWRPQEYGPDNKFRTTDSNGQPIQTGGLHKNFYRDRELFDEGKFEILRKPPQVIMAMRRPVYDNDFPAKDLEKFEIDGLLKPRWQPEGQKNWSPDNNGFVLKADAGPGEHWLKYQHILRHPDWSYLPDAEARNKFNAELLAKRPPTPQLITDFLAYNAGEPRIGGGKDHGQNWVGDLMIECDLTVDKAQGEFRLDLAKGVDRFQARFDLTTGQCSLFRKTDAKMAQDAANWQPLGDPVATRVKGPGTYHLRFANVDARLTLWVNSDLTFGHGKAYDEPPRDQRGPQQNDLEPARIGAVNASVGVHHLKLWRDTYYSLAYDDRPADPDHKGSVDFTHQTDWAKLRTLDFKTMYVQPRHFLCLGDNSPASADSRSWGLVPERLMLGRALVVYFPFNRLGVIK